MRRLLYTLTIYLFLPFCMNAQESSEPVAFRELSDSIRYAGLDELLEEFYAAIVYEPIENKCAEMDNLIETCTDSLTRQHVAMKIYEHYRHTKLMGEEAVAIHIFDKWFATDKIVMRGEFAKIDAEIFANFNRHSLIGMKATPVELKKPLWGTMTIPMEGRMGVLFFYDTDCAKCKLEAQILPSVLKEVDFPLNFYAVYAGQSKESWKDFRKNFKIKNRSIKTYHLWDPEMDSNYQRYYAVTGTPRMYFVLEDGEIIGRRLEVANLQEIIKYIKIVNGSKEE